MRQAVAQFSVAAAVATLALLILFTGTIPLSSRIYLGVAGSDHYMMFWLATAAVCLHGVALMAITYLRINGTINLPPQLMLLTFPSMAAWYWIFPADDPSSTILGILVGNAIAALCLCLLGARTTMARTSTRPFSPIELAGLP